MTRKLVQIGSSLAVTLPAEVVKDFKLKKGQAVEVSVHPTTGVVTIRPGIKYTEGGKVTKRFRATVEKLLQERAGLYRELAK
jgi:antitoxin component of MazEF toxin-antitoxin module